MTAPDPVDPDVVPFGDDGLAPARGCLTALAISLLVYVAIFTAWAVIW